MPKWRKRDTTWEPVHPEVPGYRDIYCPICGRGPFVNAYTHITKTHGIRRFEATTRWGVLSSLRGQPAPHLEYGNWPGYQHSSSRHQRWIKAVQEEAAKGDYWVGRLAARWRVSYMTAYQRVDLLKKAGYEVPEIDRSNRTCRRGHPRTPENTWVGWREGRGEIRYCRPCFNEKQRERRKRKKR